VKQLACTNPARLINPLPVCSFDKLRTGCNPVER